MLLVTQLVPLQGQEKDDPCPLSDNKKARKLYEKALMIKQGFANYRYIVADKNKVIDEENAIDGNFYQTENNYFTIVYYRENNQRYDRVIGKGTASSIDIIN